MESKEWRSLELLTSSKKRNFERPATLKINAPSKYLFSPKSTLKSDLQLSSWVVISICWMESLISSLALKRLATLSMNSTTKSTPPSSCKTKMDIISFMVKSLMAKTIGRATTLNSPLQLTKLVSRLTLFITSTKFQFSRKPKYNNRNAQSAYSFCQ